MTREGAGRRGGEIPGERRGRSRAGLLAACAVAAAWLAALPAAAAPAGPAGGAAGDAGHSSAVAAWVEANRRTILDELEKLLSVPNSAIDLPAMRANADHLADLLERRGMKARFLETGASGPYIYAELPPGDPPPGAEPLTVLFYCHYDGQPVDPARWTVGPPHQPTLRGELDDPEARIYARSASDDKSPIVAILSAVDGLRHAGIPPRVHAKLILDPEEEVGSPNLSRILADHADLLAADLMVFADGPVHQSGRPTVVFGTRGIVTVTLELYGPASALHSGHYGNWAPNPAEKLAELLATMKDREGRVLVEGFYDGVEPLSGRGLRALGEIPAVEPDLMERLLIARPDGGGRSLQELINLPSLNVRGLRSAWVGDEARTIVPDSATAEIDMRLVKGVTPGGQVERLRAHIRRQGYTVVEHEPTAAERRRSPLLVRMSRSGGVRAVRTSMETPLSRALIAAVEAAVEEPLVLMPTLGGTGPLSPFEEILGLPVYVVPIVNADNNQHGPDENLRLGNLWRGIVIHASLLRLAPPGGG